MENDEAATMNAEIRALKETVARLEAKVADLRAALELEAESTTRHLGSLNESLGGAYDLLMPLVYKAYPKFEGDQRRINSILRPSVARSDDAKKG